MQKIDPSIESAPVHLVDSDASVERALSSLEKLEEIALDTEFHSERRYHAELMLIQICAPSGESWLIDPKAVDVAPIIRAVSARKVVVHSGWEDLAIMQREAQTAPHDILDVQIGAGMLGLGYPSRLSNICHSLLGQNIDKGATLSDWAARPLQKHQLDYATQDVRILLPLAQRVRSELRTRGRLQWAVAASAELALRATRPARTKHIWTDWDIAHQFDIPTRAALQTVFEWRDARGRDKDQPPHFMLSDGLALDVARRRPKNLTELQANRRVPQGLIRRFGAEIINALSHANISPLVPIYVPTQTQRETATGLQLWAAIQSKSTDIAAELAMPRPLALKIAREGIEALTGWRAEAFGDALASLLKGQEGLFLGPDKTEIR